MTRHLVALASALAALTVAAPAPAQQIQLRAVRVLDPIDQAQPGTPTKKPSTEFKPDANASPDPKSLEVPEETRKKGDELVARLGSPAFKERDAATRELKKLGRAAMPALTQARDSSGSAEVQMRVAMVLTGAEADDMKARVACFLADTDGKFQHHLPGWAKYKEVAGDDKPARDLFAEMLKSTKVHAMLMAADRGAGEAGQVMGVYFREMQNVMWGRAVDQSIQQMKTPEMAGLTFLEGLFGDKDTGQVGQWGQYLSASMYWYNSPDFNAVLSKSANGKYPAPVKKLIGRWLETRETAPGLQQAMQHAQNMYGYNSKEMLRFNARILAAEVNQQTYYIKTQAIMSLGSQNAKEYVPDLAKVFEDTTTIQQAFKNPGNPEVHEVLMQDFALATAVQLTGQSPKDYGFDSTTQYGTKWQQAANFFKDSDKLKADDKRKAAFKKWAAWEKENKDKPKTGDPKKDDKKDGGKPTEPKKDDPKTPDEQKQAEAREAEAKASAAKAAAEKAAAEKDAKKAEELKKDQPKLEAPSTGAGVGPPPPTPPTK